jgi:hypothetical protein
MCDASIIGVTEMQLKVHLFVGFTVESISINYIATQAFCWRGK